MLREHIVVHTTNNTTIQATREDKHVWRVEAWDGTSQFVTLGKWHGTPGQIRFRMDCLQKWEAPAQA